MNVASGETLVPHGGKANTFSTTQSPPSIFSSSWGAGSLGPTPVRPHCDSPSNPTPPIGRAEGRRRA